jgi:hypothetical protein
MGLSEAMAHARLLELFEIYPDLPAALASIPSPAPA